MRIIGVNTTLACINQKLSMQSNSLLMISKGSLLLNNTNITVDSGSEIQLRNRSWIIGDSSSQIVLMEDGRIRVLGKSAGIRGNVMNVAGILSCDTISFSVSGNYSQSPYGTLVMRKSAR